MAGSQLSVKNSENAIKALVRLLLLRLTIVTKVSMRVSNCPSTELSAHVHLISLVDLMVNELQE